MHPIDPATFQRIRAGTFLLGLAPLARLVVLGFGDGLTANPIEFITRSTGTWTLGFLLITLAVTPLRRALGWPWLLRLRRMLASTPSSTAACTSSPICGSTSSSIPPPSPGTS